MPTLSTRAIAVKSAFELIKALQNMIDTKNIQFNNNELKEIQKLSKIITDISASKVFESMIDKQLPRVKRIFQDNSVKNRITLHMVNFRGWACT